MIEDYAKIITTSDNIKQSLIDNFYDSVEESIEYVGCSAIEDKLQHVRILLKSM